MAHQITCGHCHGTHPSVAAVKACHTGDLFSCHWLVQIPGHWAVIDDETGETDYIESTVRDCGADAISTDRGWTCAAGHEHVTMDARWAEGWDYVADAGEALALIGTGRTPFTMEGRLATSPADFLPAPALA